MNYTIPGQGELTLKTIILDLNGTLTVGGVIVPGVKEQIDILKQREYRVILLTGNTRNDADAIAEELGIEWMQAKNAEEKKTLALKLDPETCVSIGNGLIDAELMDVVKVAIVTLQAEGVHVKTLLNSDIIIPTITDALDLLIDEQRLIATLRK